MQYLLQTRTAEAHVAAHAGYPWYVIAGGAVLLAFLVAVVVSCVIEYRNPSHP